MSPNEEPARLWPAIAEALYRIRNAEKLVGKADYVLVKDIPIHPFFLLDNTRGPDGKITDHQMLYATILVHMFIVGLVISACARFLWPTILGPKILGPKEQAAQ